MKEAVSETSLRWLRAKRRIVVVVGSRWSRRSEFGPQRWRIPGEEALWRSTQNCSIGDRPCGATPRCLEEGWGGACSAECCGIGAIRCRKHYCLRWRSSKKENLAAAKGRGVRSGGDCRRLGSNRMMNQIVAYNSDPT